MPIQLSPDQQLELSKILEESTWLKSVKRASELVKLLPAVQPHWEPDGDPRLMALTLVGKADEHGAIEKLVSALEHLGAGSGSAIKAREFLNDVGASANFDRATRTALVEILDKASLTPVQLRTLVRRSAPYSVTESTDVAAAVRHLASLPRRPEGFPYPLIEFATRASHKETVAKVSARLGEWANAASATKNVTSDLHALQDRLTKAEAEASPVVMIVLEPHPDDPKMFAMAMWLWDVEDMPCARELPQTTMSMEQVQAAINAELHAISEQLETMDLRFEVFVPKSMANHDFDSWRVQLGIIEAPRKLGEFFTTSIRSLERLKIRALRARWRSKWKRFRAALSSGAAPAFIVCSATCKAADFRRDLDASDAVMIGFCFAPCGATAALMDHVLEAGVPVGVWLRRDNHDPDLVQHVQALLTTASDELPRRLFDRRRTDLANSAFWDSLNVLWDDPDRVPPLAKLIAPT